jgi:hypothetical protein
LRGGVGVGWRSEIAGVVGDLPGLGFCEVIAESMAECRRAAAPRAVAELDAIAAASLPRITR